jgi:hypothetical protein
MGGLWVYSSGILKEVERIQKMGKRKKIRTIAMSR